MPVAEDERGRPAGFPAIYLDSLGLDDMSIVAPGARSSIPGLARLTARSRDREHVWAAREYVSPGGVKHGAVLTIHLQRSPRQPIVELEYRTRAEPRSSRLTMPGVWRAAAMLLRAKRSYLVSAHTELTSQQVAALPFKLPRRIEGLPQEDRVVGFRIERRHDDKVLYTLYLDYAQTPEKYSATIAFTREATNFDDAPFVLATTASQLVKRVLGGAT